jgi:hypothetical protein
MSFESCIDTIQAAAGRKLSDEELDDLLTSLQLRQRYIQAKGLVQDSAEAALQAAEEVANNIKMAAVIEKRNAAINLTKRVEKVAWVQKNFGNNLAEGLEAILVGVNRAKQGAREGAAQLQKAIKDTYLAGFTADLERTGHMDLFASGSMDREVGRALWALGRESETADLAKLPKEAVDIARVVNKWQEVSRLEANEAGAWIGKQDGYIVRQTHDAEKIRGKGAEEDFARWKSTAIEKFDTARMQAEQGFTDLDKMLRATWHNLATGNHLKAIPEREISGFKGPGNLAKRVSQDRIIHFKDADSWFDYNQIYGSRNLREGVVSGLSHSADSLGLMKSLGTNPGALFETIKNDLIVTAKDSGKLDQVTRIADAKEKLDNYMKAVDGSMNIPGNALLARVGANIRGWKMMSSLGSMVFSQLNDVAVYAAGARYQGRGVFEGMGEAISGLGRSLKPAERRELLSSLGVVLDNAIGELGRVDSFAQPGRMARAQQLFMKLNLGEWWVQHMRASAALGMSHDMAQQAGKAWAELNPDFQRILSTYDITPDRWDHIRSAPIKTVEGKGYLVPESVENRETADKLRTYLTDQTQFLALEPDAKTRAILLRGTQPGTKMGEFMRFLMQFKSFTGAYMQKILGRELYGRGYEGDSLWGALRHGNGEFTGLAQLIVTSTIMGYASMQLKALAKGQTVSKPESAGQVTQQFLAAMLQGGGMGIYGDFLFGQASRFGGGMLETAAGPVISEVGRIVDLYHKALTDAQEQGPTEAGRRLGASVFREAINNTPFVNLFYSRIALDYMIFYRIQEMMNPGYLHRAENNVKQQQREFLVKPSSVVH